jgi:DNA repair exonuclease SbcCD ATPase subunit
MPTPLKTIAKFPWKDQAVWFLNGFWESHDLQTPKAREEQPHPLCEAEVIYGVLKEFTHLDEEAQRAKGKTRDEFVIGSDLDEFWSHRLLEKLNNTLTVVEMREALKAIDATKDGRMSLIEYLLWRYQVTVQAVEKAPQGGNSEELREAQEQFKAVERAMADTASKLEKQQAALAENNKKLKEVEAARKEADAAYAELKAAEDAVRAAEAELAAAVAELKRQEDEYAQKKATLAAKKEDENLGVVARNKASNELDQLLAEDPLPLRRAKITQEAALRKVQKERKVAEEKTAVAQAKRDELRQKEEQLAHAKAQLEQAVADLEAAYDDLQRQMAVAEEKLEAAKQKGGVPLGQMWLMDRDLYEADKRLPTRRQRFNHSKPFEWAGPQ